VNLKLIDMCMLTKQYMTW